MKDEEVTLREEDSVKYIAPPVGELFASNKQETRETLDSTTLITPPALTALLLEKLEDIMIRFDWVIEMGFPLDLEL
jgi:hypothetical protein